jgi:hypothetical protein
LELIVVEFSEKTDWDDYYDHVPWTAHVTRRITTSVLIDLIHRHQPARQPVIVEPGGANSCFYQSFTSKFSPSKYYLFDLNAKGLKKFSDQNQDGRAHCVLGDILNDVGALKGEADLVFSVGLIEHFDKADTRRAVARHFEIAKPGALVLVTFPTPVFVYRVIRGALEVTKTWKFPDERPLRFDEVRDAIAPHGEILEELTNRAIGLAQGIIIARKHR